MSTTDLLLEIGCEELPSSFVEAALAALPDLTKKRLDAARIAFGSIRALGTPRRLALLVEGVATRQSDLSEEVLGPPVKAAFKDGKPTRAAEAFAEKVGKPVAELRQIETPKGMYLAASRAEAGQPTAALMPALLEEIIRAIPFRKSMRWADLDFAFGRPIQWLVALLGDEVVHLEIATKKSARRSLGHRFLATGAIEIARPSAYVETLRKAHVLVEPDERRAALKRALDDAAVTADGALIEDEFLMDENLSLVEEPYVIEGSFDPVFLALPERVILEVAKGHQRYFGLRDKLTGKLRPSYLAVVNTALDRALIKKGNDRVMTARLSDAKFFFDEDKRVPLEARREKLAGVVFQKRLGTVLAKAQRIEMLAVRIGEELLLDSQIVKTAMRGAHLAKCDLVTLMVGEFPELQGEMGAAYAIAQGEPADVAEVVRDHYRPKGAADDTAASPAAALVALADRLDTLVGCFAIGLSPTGTADPFGLRRAMLGVLRTLLDRGFDLSIARLVALAFEGYEGTKLDLSLADLTAKLVAFSTDRLRGLLEAKHPADVVRAAVEVGADRPIDVRRRVIALAELDTATRAQVGEVFKRATNIASQASAGEPPAPPADAHASEHALHAAYERFAARADELAKAGDYANLLREVATIAPVMHQYFLDVFVMAEDLAVRDARLKLMRAISERCSRVARLELLAPA
ncbi:MAG: glycine--tRNA ligase subunit beta [Polyangiaceae bacterium]